MQTTNCDHRGATSPVLDPLLTPLDLSELLDVPVATLADWCLQQVGPPSVDLGWHVRYRSSDVAVWIEERVEEARPRAAD